MNHAKRALLLIALAALVTGCAQAKSTTQRKPHIPESVAELQDINLNMLHAMIENLDAEIAAVKQVPATQYPLYEQLRATDLEGMEARKEMMLILVEHCRFSKEKLLEADEHPQRKDQIFEEWHQHKERMRVLLNDADKKVNGLERERIRLEFGLIEVALEHKLGGRHGATSE
jgi:hypothetical protein